MAWAIPVRIRLAGRFYLPDAQARSTAQSRARRVGSWTTRRPDLFLRLIRRRFIPLIPKPWH